nr:DUF2637 domain-containing protein [Streptomyces otsuchiensis]
MTRTHRILIGFILAGAVVIAAIGFVGSYAAVRDLAEEKGFGDFSPFFPIGIDAGIVVLLALDLLLTWLRIPFPLLRQTAWLLTAATVAFNGAAAWGDPLSVGMHAIIPILFIITVEAARHAVGRITDIAADKHMEGVRLWRWILAPFPTFRLWRRMKLWELRSYQEVIDLERDRLVYRARLRAMYGRAWRRRAPVEARLPLKLAHLGVPLDPDATALVTAAGTAPAVPGPGATAIGTLPERRRNGGTGAAALRRIWDDRRPGAGRADDDGWDEDEAYDGPAPYGGPYERHGLRGRDGLPAGGPVTVRSEPRDGADWPPWAEGAHGERVGAPARAGRRPDRPHPEDTARTPEQTPEPLPHLAPRAERPEPAPEPVPDPLPDFSTGGQGGDGYRDPFDDPFGDPFAEPPADTVPGSGGRRDLRAPRATPAPGPGPAPDAEEVAADQPVGLPEDADPAQTYYAAYRDLISVEGNHFPNARQLARYLDERYGVRNADGSLLSERYLRDHVRACKERYRSEVGVA